LGDAGDRPTFPGGKRAAEQGYILLDLVITLFIVMIGFAVFLGGISLAGSLSVRQNARVQGMIEERNAHAKEHTVLFQRE
jgi:hypothetical protein